MKNIFILIAILGTSLFLQSCSLFKQSVDIDMQPFSDNTTLLFQEAAKVDRPFQFKTLSTYKDIESYTEIKDKSAPLINALKGIVYYSNQIVAISNSKMSEKSKNDQLAIYIEDVLRKIDHQERLDSLGLSYSQVDSTLKFIRNSEDFREGIETADPIIKTIVITLFDRLNDLEDMIEDVVTELDERVYNDYELAIDNYLSFKELQNTTQHKIIQLYKAQSGHSNSLDSLIDSDISVANYFPDRANITQTNYDNAEKFLLTRLDNIDIMIGQLDDDKKEFMDMKKEMGKWHLQADEKVKITRNSLIVWSQSHKNLGQGIVTPPLIGYEMLIDLIAPAVESALPF